MNLYRNNLTIGSIPQLDVVVPSFFPMDGLVAYYKLDGNSNDAHGSNNGTVSGATYTASGKINGAYDFDGSNDNINCGNASILNIAGSGSEITLAAWIKVPSSGGGTILIKGYEGGNKMNWSISCNSDYLGFRVVAANGRGHRTPIGSITPDNWYFVVATCSYGDTVPIMYINGISQSLTITDSVASTYNFPSTTENVMIGSQSNNTNFFDGIIDEVGIWSRALTSDEITQLYNNGNGLTY